MKNIYDKLATKCEEAKAVRENLEQTIKSNHENYHWSADYTLEQNNQATANAQNRLKAIAQEAQAILDEGLSAYQKTIDKQYFNSVDADTASELELISKVDLDQDELEAYIRKFKDNKTALRTLEKVAEKNGYHLRGQGLYSQEVEYMKLMEKFGGNLVRELPTGNDVALNLHLNMVNAKVLSRHNDIQDREIRIVPVIG